LIQQYRYVVMTERLDATLDNYEVEGRKAEQSSYRTSQQQPMFSTSVSAPSFELQPLTAADGLVNGDGVHNVTFITHVDLHHDPTPTHEAITQQHVTTSVSLLEEPEPDYDGKDEEGENGVGGLSAEPPPPPPTVEVVKGGGGGRADQPPTPPPLPPPSSIGVSAGLELSRTIRARTTTQPRPAPADVAEEMQRDEAHEALMAAVQRRRNLLDSVDAELIADSIETRVQRSKMLQTVYRADHGAASAAERRGAGADQSSVEQQRVSLLAVADPPAPAQPAATTTTFNGGGDFTSEAERVRLDYVRRLQSPAAPPSPPPVSQPPQSKPVRTQPPKSSENGVVAARRPEPPPPPPRRYGVNEGHNRALAAYVNGSSKLYPVAAADVTTSTTMAAGNVHNVTRSSVIRLHHVGESTTELSPRTPAAAATSELSSQHDRRLRVVTEDTASVLSSLSTLSTNSSVGVGGGGTGDGGVSPHGSPSQSSSGDSGFAKSSSTTGTGAEQAIIPPPREFASPSDNSSSSSSSASVQTAVGGVGGAVRRQGSHSVVFPARAHLTQR